MIDFDLIQIAFAIVTIIVAPIAIYAGYKTRNIYREFRDTNKTIHNLQRQQLRDMSEFKKQLMAQTLQIAPQYAFSSQYLPGVQLSDGSLFDRRRSHFAPEKERLAEMIVDILREEIVTNKKLKIILVLDSGSTVFPIFQKLCNHPNFKFDRFNAKRVKIITNNLPGVSELVTHGRIGDPIGARTLFRCRILKGYAHSQYEASLGPQTGEDLEKAVKEFKDDLYKEDDKKYTGKNVKIISVITGNYVSIEEGPMARDADHVDTKSAMIDVADKCYVLAPLGKVLPFSCKEINDLLGLKEEERRYDTLKEWEKKSQNVTLVVTTREAEYFSQIDPPSIGFYLGHAQAKIYDKFVEPGKLITIPMDPAEEASVRVQGGFLERGSALRYYEIPHRNLREGLIKKVDEKYIQERKFVDLELPKDIRSA